MQTDPDIPCELKNKYMQYLMGSSWIKVLKWIGDVFWVAKHDGLVGFLLGKELLQRLL
jgi:hypothetical protein